MKKLFLAIMALSVGFASCVKDDPYVAPQEPPVEDSPLKGQVFLNEINGTPASDNDRYIEVYNDTNAPVNLEGVTISYHNAGTLTFTVSWTGTSASTVPAKGFMLLKGTKNTDPGNEGNDLSTGLSGSQGIFVRMLDADGKMIDDFAVLADEQRPSANRVKSYARIPDGGTWYYDAPAGTQNATNGNTTAGKNEIVFATPPSISQVGLSEESPTPNTTIGISAIVTPGEGTLSSVVLSWTANGADQPNITMTANGNVYSASFPGQPDLTTVNFTITATNNKNASATNSGSFFVTSAPVVTDGTIFVNECDPNEKQWEFYNPGTNHVNIAGWKLRKDNDDEYVFPAGTIIPAGGYKVFVQDESGAAGPDFGMSPTKGFKYELLAPGAEPESFVSKDVFDNLGPNILNDKLGTAGTTLARVTDGSAKLATFSTGTIGKSNSDASGVPYPSVVYCVPAIDPATPTAQDVVTLTINVSYYQVMTEGDFSVTSATGAVPTSTQLTGDKVLTVAIPAQAVGSYVYSASYSGQAAYNYTLTVAD